MNDERDDRLRRLLREAVAPVCDEGPQRDLWPAVLERVHAAAREERIAAPWYDWALAASVVAFAVFVPASIPVLLYYL
jgi:hypothetical protein